MSTGKVLVVGGGGGGATYYGGGGAGGEVEYDASHSLSATAYGVTVGAGGAHGTGNGDGVVGSDSVFDGITGLGGGYGGGNGGNNGGNGGNGGGGAGSPSGSAGTGGTGSPGNNGGNGRAGVPGLFSGAGGGGGASGGAGANSPSSQVGGAGGAGVSNSITGSAVSYGGGGGGSGQTTAGAGGAGGGGVGSWSGAGGAGTAGLGGGGGGSGDTSNPGGNGGAGVVIVAYLTADFGGHTGGDATGTDGSYTWVKFTSSGTLTLISGLDLPVVETDAVSSIADVSAVGNGEVTDVGIDDVTQRGFVFSTSTHSDPGNVDPASSDYESVEAESGTFSAEVFDLLLTSLDPSTTYYVRAFAENSDGFSYGDEVDFDTLATPPWRFENLPGVVYDPEDHVTIFAERLNDILDRLDALE